jgi:hypothetical protein
MDNPTLERLAAFGVLIERRPGEFRVNYRGGKETTARYADSFAEAVAAGFQMAAERPEPPTPTARPRRASRRAFVRRHNRRWGARQHVRAAKEHAKAERRAFATLSFSPEV